MEDLKQKTIRGGIARLCGQALDFVLRIASLIILARLLDPKDFGLVSMVTVVTSFYGLSLSGLAAPIIQSSSITDEQLSTLFWINMLIGTVLALLCVLTAPVLASFYGDQRLFWVTATIAVGFVFSAAEMQHSALLQRQLRFVALSLIEALRLTASTTIAVGMALAGFGYWALVASLVLSPLIGAVCLWTITRWIPGLPGSIHQIRPMLHFGGTISLNGLVVFVAYNFEKVLLGRFWGAEDLGLYGRAYQLITIPTHNLNAAVGGVAVSALSRLHSDPPRLKTYFLKAYAFVNSLTLPTTIFCVLFADEIIAVALGPNWTGAAPVFRMLAPTVLVFGLINPLAWLLTSIGLQKRSLTIALVIAPVVMTAYVLGLPYGPAGVAFAYSAAMVLWVIPHVLWCLNGTTISARDLFWATWRPFLSAVVAAAFAFGAQFYIGDEVAPLLSLVLGGGIMAAVYLSMLLFGMGKNRLYLDLLSILRTDPRAI